MRITKGTLHVHKHDIATYRFLYNGHREMFRECTYTHFDMRALMGHRSTQALELYLLYKESTSVALKRGASS